MQENVVTTDTYVQSLPDWQQTNLKVFRATIHSTHADVTEGIKWGVPVFTLNGKTLFAMASFKDHTKYNFIANGAALEDPDNLFNNGLDSKKSRSIDMRQGQDINAAALADLVAQAFAKL